MTAPWHAGSEEGDSLGRRPTYVSADDITDAGTATAFSHLDMAVVLSRDPASQGLYAATPPGLLFTTATGESALTWGLPRIERLGVPANLVSNLSEEA
jgi:hypothetical protein